MRLNVFNKEHIDIGILHGFYCPRKALPSGKHYYIYYSHLDVVFSHYSPSLG